MAENIYFPLSGAGGGSEKIVQFEPDPEKINQNCIDEELSISSVGTITMNGLSIYKYMGMLNSSSQIYFINKDFYETAKNTDKPFIIPTKLTVKLYAPESTTTVAATETIERNIVYYYADKYIDGGRDMRLFKGKTSYKIGLSSFDIEVNVILQSKDSDNINSLRWDLNTQTGTLSTYSTNVKIEGLFIPMTD